MGALFGHGRAGHELRCVALGGTLDVCGAVGPQQDILGLQELFEAQAQHGPVLLLDGEVAPEVEYGDLAHAPTHALAAHQAEGEIGLAGDLVAGTGLTDIHLPDARRKSKGKFA